MTRVVHACADCGEEVAASVESCSACGGEIERVDPVLVATMDFLEDDTLARWRLEAENERLRALLQAVLPYADAARITPDARPAWKRIREAAVEASRIRDDIAPVGGQR